HANSPDDGEIWASSAVPPVPPVPLASGGARRPHPLRAGGTWWRPTARGVPARTPRAGVGGPGGGIHGEARAARGPHPPSDTAVGPRPFSPKCECGEHPVPERRVSEVVRGR